MHGKTVNTISLLVRQHGQLDFDVQTLKAESDGKFQSTMENIKSSTEYFVSAEDVQSPKYNITVLDRPLIRSLQLKIHSPAYTRIPPNIPEENIGDLTAYPGSAVSIKIISSKSLSSAMLMFNDSSKLSLESNDAEASGSFTVRKNGSYHIVITDHDHLPNIDPVEYTIKIIPDEYPTVLAGHHRGRRHDPVLVHQVLELDGPGGVGVFGEGPAGGLVDVIHEPAVRAVDPGVQNGPCVHETPAPHFPGGVQLIP